MTRRKRQKPSEVTSDVTTDTKVKRGEQTYRNSGTDPFSEDVRRQSPRTKVDSRTQEGSQITNRKNRSNGNFAATTKAHKEKNEPTKSSCENLPTDVALRQIEDIENQPSVTSRLTKDFQVNFASQACSPRIHIVRQYGERKPLAQSILHQLYLGRTCGGIRNRTVTSQPVIEMVKGLSLYRTASPFQRRVQAIDWHPVSPTTVAVASKFGEIILWNIDQINQDVILPGGGVGDQINSMKFVPSDHSKLMTTSANGMVQFRDLSGKQSQVLLDTQNFVEHWYCGADISGKQDMVIAGDNLGYTQIVSSRAEKGWKHRLHKSKVTHVEFSLIEPSLFCTASVDRTVKLWDVRMVKDRNSTLCVLEHDKPVNSAHFSPSDGIRLLTTDQYDQLRLFAGPEWRLERTIRHPHRQFQHLTSIKATWHPLVDLIVVGRYPDKDSSAKEGRTIDIFSADSGEIVCQLDDPSTPGIVSLNKFSPRGDCLVSGMGYHILAWSRRSVVEEKQRHLLEAMKSDGLELDMEGRRRRGGTRRGEKKDGHSQTKTSMKLSGKH